jgi:hypothetical protein
MTLEEINNLTIEEATVELDNLRLIHDNEQAISALSRSQLEQLTNSLIYLQNRIFDIRSQSISEPPVKQRLVPEEKTSYRSI